MCNAYLISYIKARAEDIIDDCSVGWWQRGERCVTLLIGMATGHIPAILWQLAVLPLFTVMRRILYARAVLDAQRRGSPPPNRGPMPGVLRYAALWRHPRGSIGFDVVAFANVAFIIVAPWVCPFFYGDNDPLRALLNSLTG
jgi:hypothetical protein